MDILEEGFGEFEERCEIEVVDVFHEKCDIWRDFYLILRRFTLCTKDNGFARCCTRKKNKKKRKRMK